MSVLTIKSHRFAPTGLIDAKALGYRTFLDGDYFQYFTSAVSGLDQATVLRAADDEGEALMWRAVASVAADQIKAAVAEGARTGTIPKPDPTHGVALVLDLQLVRQRMVSDDLLPATVAEGTVLATFEV